MAAIPRKTQKVFGGSLTPSGNLGVVGSLAAGSPAYSGDLATLQSLSNYLGGFASCTVGNSSPAMQDMNSLFYLITTQLAYILQRGLPEWDSGTTYFSGCRVSSGNDSYYSLQDSNTNHAVSDTSWWQKITDPLYYESAEVAVPFPSATGQITTVSHGLGSVPKFFTVCLRCKTAELGYSVGDEIFFNGAANFGSGGSGQITTFANATSIGILNVNDFTVIKYSATTTIGPVAVAKWKLVFRAWK